MKEKPFTAVFDFCDNGQTDCGVYMTTTEFVDRGYKWALFSLPYKEKDRVISEVELLKNKAYEPYIDLDDNSCLYFRGMVD